MLKSQRSWSVGVLVGLFAVGGLVCTLEARQPSTAVPAPTAAHSAVVNKYCVFCHNANLKTGGLALDAISSDEVGRHSETWEKVVRKLRGRQMPPIGMPRPDEDTYNQVITSLSASLDEAADSEPNPGRPGTFRRLTRTEYRNSIRDLLSVDLDVSTLLPGDESSFGFDNVTVGDLPPILMDRYVSAAQKVSRLAVGRSGRSPGGDTIRIRPDLTQEEHFEGLPIGTRGGTLLPYTFPVNGEYEIQVRLSRDRNEHVEGLYAAHELELLLDRERVQVFTIEPPPHEQVEENYFPSHANVDRHLKARVPVTAGPHTIGVTFLKNPSVLIETARQPFQAHFNYHRHPRIQPAVFQISIIGPYDAEGPGDTPSRERIFVCQPANASEEDGCAERILKALTRRAYRRPVTDEDIQDRLELYRTVRAKEGFDAGIEVALAAILVSPEFLFRIEQDPADLENDTAYSISDLELASRLSFFLWSSIPDDELLDIAIEGNLRKPGVLGQQVRRMLADPRSRNLITNFVSQWLHLRNLESVAPDMRLFPDFDDNLRQALRQETELFVESVIGEDRNVLDLLSADYTFVNERLAKHYGIPHVYGDRFRRITLDEDNQRGGLLRQGSILTVTSYATRTSPVIRGKWILENILGTPPPPPPANVPELKEKPSSAEKLSMRDRLAEHRNNPACSSCHNLMDPVGFALENYDAVGRYRTVEGGVPVDSSGELFDGTKFDGIGELQSALLARPDLFVNAIAEKLLVFATGRGVEYFDGPALRKVVRDAKEEDYRFSSLILGIVNSKPFQMRRSG